MVHDISIMVEKDDQVYPIHISNDRTTAPGEQRNIFEGLAPRDDLTTMEILNKNNHWLDQAAP